MIRGTTPTFTLTIADTSVDLGQAENIYFTLTQGSNAITKSGEDLEVGTRTVNVFLTQEESIDLIEGAGADIQLNWTYLDPGGSGIVRRAATKVKTIQITKQILRRVIP